MPQGEIVESKATVVGDLGQVAVQISTDRLTNILNEHVGAVEHNSRWIAPGTTLVALVSPFLTATFRDGAISAAHARDAYMLAIGADALWLIYELCQFRKKKTVAELVDRIMERSRTSSTAG